ncbi:hypothetical protein KFK09_013211 [Dendrobium nobile]|uniref:Uncharacterized protein n=1 Tax=Dendrobium nobile TaxID=94219 RepID=A0A8T3B6Q8_DENNO|nr:hypothetical protein KFK09_013211 [Dendrobium nobile]
MCVSFVLNCAGEKDMDPPAESSVPNEQHSAAPMPSESMMQLATAIAHVMGDAQSKMSGSKEEEVDRHLQMFHKLKPPLFKGAVGPQAAEDWIMRVEKILIACSVRGIEKYHWQYSCWRVRQRDGGSDSRERNSRGRPMLRSPGMSSLQYSGCGLYHRQLSDRCRKLS